RTLVRQVAFVEKGDAEEGFVGMCFSKGIVEGVGEKFPMIRGAGDMSPEHYPPGTICNALFWALQTAHAASSDAPQLKNMWLNGGNLFRLLGTRIHREHVEWDGSLSERDCRYILRSTHPYVAAVKEDQLQFLFSRDRLALLVARQLAEKSAA